MGPSSGLAAVAASAVLTAGITGEDDVATFVAGITWSAGPAVPAARRAADELDRPVPLAGGRHRVPLRRRDRRRHRRAPEDHRAPTPTAPTRSQSSGPGSAPGRRSDPTTFASAPPPSSSRSAYAGWRPSVPSALVLLVGGLRRQRAAGPRGARRRGRRRDPERTPRPDGPGRGAAVGPRGRGLDRGGRRWCSSASRRRPATPRCSRPGTATGSTWTRRRSPRASPTRAPGLLQGMPVSTSLSASSLNDHSGARTGLASLTSGIVVVLTLLFLAPLFAGLPQPVLAALIIEAVVMGMMDVRRDATARPGAAGRLLDRRRLDPRRPSPSACSPASSSGSRCRCSGWSRSRPARRCRSSAASPARRCSGSSTEHPDDERFPGVAVLRLEGGLFFATSEALDERVRRSSRTDPSRHLRRARLLGDQLRRLPGRCGARRDRHVRREEQVTLRLARLKPGVSATLSRDGMLTTFDAAKIHNSVDEAVQAQLGS